MIEMKCCIENEENVRVEMHAHGEDQLLLKELACGCADMCLELSAQQPEVKGLPEIYANLLLSYVLDVIRAKQGMAAN